MSLYTKIIDLQKLDASLQKVLKNKPAAGVDGITYDMFEANKKEYLKQLYLELEEHRYHPLPVKLVNLYKGEKMRTVALYAMRDKVVQQSIVQELQKIMSPLCRKRLMHTGTDALLCRPSTIWRPVCAGMRTDGY